LLCRFADPHHGAVPAAFGKSQYGKTHSRPEKQGKIDGKAFTIRSGAVERGFISGMLAGTG
jgi:hypothetical protein